MQVRKIHAFTGHKDCIYTGTLDSTRKTLYTAGGDGMIVAWNLDAGDQGEMQVKVDKAVFSLCFLDDKTLLVGSNQGNLYRLNLDSKKEERNIEAHSGGLFDIVRDQENKLIYTAGFDGVLNIWDEELTLLKKVRISEKSLRSLIIIPGAIAVASSDASIYILDPENHKVKQKLQGHTNSVFALAYNPLTNEMLSGGRDCYIKIWDMTSLTFKKEYVGATLHINSIAFDPGYNRYCISSMDKTIKIFDAQTHQPLKFIDKAKNDGHTSSVNKSIWVNPARIVSMSDDKKAMLWELENDY